MADVNFFWCGQNFYFLEYIVIMSHLKVGHNAIIWLHGERPSTKYWQELENNVAIKNADTIFNTSDFISNGGNNRTAADLWRFNLLYQRGGLYCDTDAFALKTFPDDEWIVCSAETIPDTLSIGVLKAPPNHPIFQECINMIKMNWGNIQIFSQAYKNFYGNTNPTHISELFYPYKWADYKRIVSNYDIPLNSYSLHFYSNALEHNLPNSNNFIGRLLGVGKGLQTSDLNEEWCEIHSKTLLGKLWKWLLNGYSI